MSASDASLELHTNRVAQIKALRLGRVNRACNHPRRRTVEGVRLSSAENG